MNKRYLLAVAVFLAGAVVQPVSGAEIAEDDAPVSAPSDSATDTEAPPADVASEMVNFREGFAAANGAVANVPPLVLVSATPDAIQTGGTARETPPEPAVVKMAEPPPRKATLTLHGGRTISHELQAWADQAGWKVIWNMSRDWSVPADATFYGTFEEAAGEALRTLAENGALISGKFYMGNKTLVVAAPGEIRNR